MVVAFTFSTRHLSSSIPEFLSVFPCSDGGRRG
nr:MAG TPA: hypothetical protein [Caudoviricetes sp.]